MRKKCLYRGIKPEIPETFDERVLRLKRQWEQGLGRQIKDIPDFNHVYNEVKAEIKNLFSERDKMKGGLNVLEAHYSIKYRRDNVEIEVHGDKDFVEKKFNELLELKPSVKKIVSEKPVTKLEPERKPSLAEFLKSKDVKTHGDKILVFGYYLEKYESLASFNLIDIKNCYAKARIPKTKNFSQYITGLISQGYLMDAKDKKDNKRAWMLTDSGMRYVEEKL